jgi:hypothetical protein
VLTGEEEDETIHSVRGKLFVLSEQNQWKERGSGLLRLNRRKVDRGGARIGGSSHILTFFRNNQVDSPPLSSLSRKSDAEGRRIRRIAKRNTIPGHELQYRSGPAVPAV